MSATLTPPPEAPPRDGDATPALDRVVRSSRRRMRLNRVLSLAPTVIGGAAAVVALWLVAGRLVLLPDVDLAVAVGAAAVGAAVLLGAAVTRIPDAWAAWAADRWLGTRDAFATAVELRTASRGGTLDAGQIAHAEERAEGFRGWPDGPNVPGRRLGVAALGVLVAATLAALPNPMDDIRQQRAAERAAIEREAEELRELADELESSPEPELRELADELDRLAEELLAAEDTDEALERIEQARAELARQLEADLASQRTALTGLARELGREPLAPGDTVRSQLDALAESLAAGQPGDPAEQAELAERLAELADALAAGQPELAQGLREAGEALAGGDTSAAASAISRASGQVGESLRHLTNQDAVDAAVGALDDASQAVRDAQQGDGQGDGDGDGDGSGQGQGDGTGSGQGQGDGTGQGQGDGSGSGDGDGSGSGDGDGDGSGSGQGQGSGQTQGGGGGGNPTGTDGQGGTNTGGTGNAGSGAEPDLTTVYDPTRVAGDGEDLNISGRDTGQGDESTVGRREGEGVRNSALVPYRDVLAEYLDIATRTIERPGYPVELRDLVRTYFDAISTTRD